MTVKRYGIEIVAGMADYKRALERELPSATKRGVDSAALAWVKGQQRISELTIREATKAEYAKANAAEKAAKQAADAKIREETRANDAVDAKLFKLYQDQQRLSKGAALFNVEQELMEINDLQDELADLNRLTADNVKLLDQRRDAARRAFASTVGGDAAASANAAAGATRNLGNANAEAAKKTSIFAQTNKNLAFQVADVIQSVQAGQDPMRALSIQLSDVGFQYGSAEFAAHGFSRIVGLGGPLLIGLAAVGTTLAVVGNATAESRAKMSAYQRIIDDTTASSKALATASRAVAGAQQNVASFVGDLQIKAAALRGELSESDLVAGELGDELATSLGPQLRAARAEFVRNETRIAQLNQTLTSASLSMEEYADANRQLAVAEAARPNLQASLDEVNRLYDRGRGVINEYAGEIERKAEAERLATEATEAEAAALQAKADALARVQAQQAAGDALRAKMLADAMEQTSAEQALRDVARNAADDMLLPMQRINEERDRQLEQLDALIAVTGATAEAQAAADAIVARSERDKQAVADEMRAKRAAQDEEDAQRVTEIQSRIAQSQAASAAAAPRDSAPCPGNLGRHLSQAARRAALRCWPFRRRLACKLYRSPQRRRSPSRWPLFRPPSGYRWPPATPP
jgi:hypothetical protein